MKRIARQCGFTLIEVLAAAVILSAALSVVIGSIAHSINASQDVEFKTRASELCSEMLDRAAVGEFGKMPAEGVEVFPRVEFNWQITSQAVENISEQESVLTCDVTWSSKNKTRSVSMQRRVLVLQQEPNR